MEVAHVILSAVEAAALHRAGQSRSPGIEDSAGLSYSNIMLHLKWYAKLFMYRLLLVVLIVCLSILISTAPRSAFPSVFRAMPRYAC